MEPAHQPPGSPRGPSSRVCPSFRVRSLPHRMHCIAVPLAPSEAGHSTAHLVATISPILHIPADGKGDDVVRKAVAAQGRGRPCRDAPPARPATVELAPLWRSRPALVNCSPAHWSHCIPAPFFSLSGRSVPELSTTQRSPWCTRSRSGA